MSRVGGSPLSEHELVLVPRPFLKRREVEPIRSAVLMDIVRRVARPEVIIGIRHLQELACPSSPSVRAIAVEIIAEIPRHVRVRGEPRNHILMKRSSSALPAFG